MHFFATCMVCLGAHFSAIWIVVANSWMQTPAGFHIVGEGLKARAEITDFWAMVFNPSSMDRLFHTLCGAWQAGAFLVVSVSAWYLLKRRHEEFARALAAKSACRGPGRVAAAAGQRPHQRAGRGEEPAGQARRLRGAYETTSNAPLTLFGWVDEKNERSDRPGRFRAC
jgi:cytochrome d ubiquinol oxidase subunit I